MFGCERSPARSRLARHLQSSSLVRLSRYSVGGVDVEVCRPDGDGHVGNAHIVVCNECCRWRSAASSGVEEFETERGARGFRSLVARCRELMNYRTRLPLFLIS